MRKELVASFRQSAIRQYCELNAPTSCYNLRFVLFVDYSPASELGSTTSRAGSSVLWLTWKDPCWPRKARSWWRKPATSTAKANDSSEWESLWKPWKWLRILNHSPLPKTTTRLHFRHHLPIKQLFPLSVSVSLSLIIIIFFVSFFLSLPLFLSFSLSLLSLLFCFISYLTSFRWDRHSRFSPFFICPVIDLFCASSRRRSRGKCQDSFFRTGRIIIQLHEDYYIFSNKIKHNFPSPPILPPAHTLPPPHQKKIIKISKKWNNIKKKKDTWEKK